MTAATQPGLDRVVHTSAGKAGHTALSHTARRCRRCHGADVERVCCVWAAALLCPAGAGWPWAPFRGSRPLLLPPSLGTSPLLHLKTTLSTSKVGVGSPWGQMQDSLSPGGHCSGTTAWWLYCARQH
jgi:hypothetical protein